MRNPENLTDAELLLSTSTRPEAFATFYRRHELMVIGFLRRRTRDSETAADIAAETFASALESASSFDPSKSEGGATSWLLTIASNTLISSLRRGKVADQARKRLEMDRSLVVDGDTSRDIDEAAKIDPRLMPSLRALPEHERSAVQARIVEEKDYSEMADELKCSELVARKRVSRGLSRLRSLLSEAG